MPWLNGFNNVSSATVCSRADRTAWSRTFSSTFASWAATSRARALDHRERRLNLGCECGRRRKLRQRGLLQHCQCLPRCRGPAAARVGEQRLERDRVKRPPATRCEQEVERVVLQRAAESLRLKETPLVARLRLQLRRKRTVVLRRRHLTRRESREHRRHHRKNHGCAAENLSPQARWEVRL
jgi:hypothetical protein